MCGLGWIKFWCACKKEKKKCHMWLVAHDDSQVG